MREVIRIGTRDSELALWQANHVQSLLQQQGYSTELVPVKSQGDIELEVPLYEMGITGIFTKTLDVALIQNHIDIAVHSMKDVPTMLPKGMVQAAVLPRANHQDWLIHKKDYDPDEPCVVATGSLRRKSQWLHRYPHHKVVNLRGNVNTRLKKLRDSEWSGAIFAAAGLQRIDLRQQIEQEYQLQISPLRDILPAPAQGVIMIAAMGDNKQLTEAVAKINHRPTELCARLERAFLRQLEGGCTAPIGALATVQKDTIHFKGTLFSLDGSRKFYQEATISYNEDAISVVRELARGILNDGGNELLSSFKQ